MPKIIHHARKRKFGRCFIAAPAKADLHIIKDVLREKGIDSIVASELPITGLSILQHISQAIAGADLIIAVIDDARQSPNIFFEIGYGFAKKKPTLVLVAPNIERLPSDVSELLYVRADPLNREAVSFALDLLLVAKRRKAYARKEALQRSKPIGKLADELLYLVNREGESLKEFEIQQILIRALRASGVDVVAESKQGDYRADLAVWSDELSPWVGNPLLIEIKSRISDLPVRALYGRLSRFVHQSNAAFVLLIVAGPLPEEAKHVSAQFPAVLPMELKDFIQKLKGDSFGQILRDLRNRHVHGLLS